MSMVVFLTWRPRADSLDLDDEAQSVVVAAVDEHDELGQVAARLGAVTIDRVQDGPLEEPGLHQESCFNH